MKFKKIKKITKPNSCFQNQTRAHAREVETSWPIAIKKMFSSSFIAIKIFRRMTWVFLKSARKRHNEIFIIYFWGSSNILQNLTSRWSFSWNIPDSALWFYHLYELEIHMIWAYAVNTKGTYKTKVRNKYIVR